MRAGGSVYALRRFGVWGRKTAGDVVWEVAAVEAFAAAGAPVAHPTLGPREIDGEMWLMMPWLGGRVLRHPPVSDAEFVRLGGLLAEFHEQTEFVPVPAQRPGFGFCAGGAAPENGGTRRRRDLLAALAEVEPAMARRFGDAAKRLEARDLPTALAGQATRIVHGDFSSWNIRLSGGHLVGVLDFELAHVDHTAADVAFARRGYHDRVVDGYVARAPLSGVEIAALDGLWLGGVLRGVWRVLEDRLAEGSDLAYGLGWHLEQLEKTRPYHD